MSEAVDYAVACGIHSIRRIIRTLDPADQAICIAAIACGVIHAVDRDDATKETVWSLVRRDIATEEFFEASRAFLKPLPCEAPDA